MSWSTCEVCLEDKAIVLTVTYPTVIRTRRPIKVLGGDLRVCCACYLEGMTAAKQKIDVKPSSRKRAKKKESEWNESELSGLG